MRTILLAAAGAILALTSCNNSHDGAKPGRDDGTATMPKRYVSGKDTLVIRSRSAVSYGPDSLLLARERRELGNEDFETSADDYAFYASEAGMFFDSVHLQHLDAGQHRYLAFVQGNALSQLVRLDTLPEPWGFYFFEPGKQPRHIDLTMAKEEYSAYFKAGK